MLLDCFMHHNDDIYLGITEWLQKVSLEFNILFCTNHPEFCWWPTESSEHLKALSSPSSELTGQVKYFSKIFLFTIKGGQVWGISINVTKRKTNAVDSEGE